MSSAKRLIEACAAGKSKDAARLVARGINPNVKDKDGWTPLIHAVRGDHVEIVRLLLGAGADPSLETKEGSTAIDWANLQGNLEIDSLLSEGLPLTQDSRASASRAR